MKTMFFLKKRSSEFPKEFINEKRNYHYARWLDALYDILQRLYIFAVHTFIYRVNRKA